MNIDKALEVLEDRVGDSRNDSVLTRDPLECRRALSRIKFYEAVAEVVSTTKDHSCICNCQHEDCIALKNLVRAVEGLG